MINLSGLHFLLTYQCTFECDHCFVWGSPWQSGTMRLEDIQRFLEQARQTQHISSIYFEGGEPFLYYATLLAAARQARQMGFTVGVVSNAYWAQSYRDALESLRPFVGLLDDLSVSSDLFHYSEAVSAQVQNATRAARALGIPVGTISIAKVSQEQPCTQSGQLPPGESGVMFRGRAAEKLSGLAQAKPWETFTACLDEDLRDPGRVHLDPFGNIHLCQGIVLGNLFETPLAEICSAFEPEAHPIVGPLLRGGPAELARLYQVETAPAYADACHLCYRTRQALRRHFPQVLKPDGVYGVFN